MPEKDNFSCIPKEPLIKLDDKGQAPIVKYSMPHDTSYMAKSFVPLEIEEDCFKDEHRKEGNVDNYERFNGKSIKEITQILHTEFSNFKHTISRNNLQNSVLNESISSIETKVKKVISLKVEPSKLK